MLDATFCYEKVRFLAMHLTLLFLFPALPGLVEMEEMCYVWKQAQCVIVISMVFYDGGERDDFFM